MVRCFFHHPLRRMKRNKPFMIYLSLCLRRNGRRYMKHNKNIIIYEIIIGILNWVLLILSEVIGHFMSYHSYDRLLYISSVLIAIMDFWLLKYFKLPETKKGIICIGCAFILNFILLMLIGFIASLFAHSDSLFELVTDYKLINIGLVIQLAIFLISSPLR